MSSLVVDVLGTKVSIVAPAPLRSELRAALVDLRAPTAGDRALALVPGDRGFDLLDDGRIVRQGVDPVVGVATLVWRLNAIAAESTGHLLLHAACIAEPHERGVLLIGGPGAGKSTLAAACVSAGCAYLSDELAAIDHRTGLVAPYAKPIALDGERLVPASSLGRVAAVATAPAVLVFPRYEPCASLAEVRLDPGWVLLGLAAHAVNLTALGATAVAWLAGLALACPARQLTHGDARAAAAAIQRLAAEPGRPVEPAKLLPPITRDTTTVALGDSLAVLHEPRGRVHVLNRSAAAVWRGAAAAATDADDPVSLVDAALDALDTADGEHPDRATAAATVGRLVRCGLLDAAVPAAP